MSSCRCGTSTPVVSPEVVADPAAPVSPGTTSYMRRGWRASQWLAPIAALALIPKCPVCLASYVALATGLGISIPAAGQLRVVMMVMCALSLWWVAIRYLRRTLEQGATAPCRIRSAWFVQVAKLPPVNRQR